MTGKRSPLSQEDIDKHAMDEKYKGNNPRILARKIEMKISHLRVSEEYADCMI